eukprot:gene25229-biopygen16485
MCTSGFHRPRPARAAQAPAGSPASRHTCQRLPIMWAAECRRTGAAACRGNRLAGANLSGVACWPPKPPLVSSGRRALSKFPSSTVEEFGGLASPALCPAFAVPPRAGGQDDLQVGIHDQTNPPRVRRAAFPPIEPPGGVGGSRWTTYDYRRLDPPSSSTAPPPLEESRGEGCC